MAVSAATEIDHILPFSRTLDNSMSNMVVCITVANRAKGNRTPHEAFGHNPPGYDYEKILAHTASFPSNKSWRFHENAMEKFEGERGFLDRQLNETRYLSRTARTYLAHLYNEKDEGQVRVRVIPGRMTSLLRNSWGLNGVLQEWAKDVVTNGRDGTPQRKQRNDHRHHAIDAFVVANTTQGLMQKFATAAARSNNAAKRLAALVPLPWEGFSRDELRPFIDRMVISHRPDHGTRGIRGKTTGQLHNDTAYGIVESGDGKSPATLVVRKPLSGFSSRKHVEAVRDHALREALLQLWEQSGEKGAEFAKQAWETGVTINGHVQRVRTARVIEQLSNLAVIRDRSGEPYKAYATAGNEFADVWLMRDGRWQIVAVPTFEANQPELDWNRFRPVDKSGRPDPTAKKLMRLQKDDMGAVGAGDDRRIVVVRKITAAASGTFVVMDDHFEANVPDRVGKDMKENRFSANQLQKQGFRKVGIDEIGRVLDPGPPR